MARFEDEAKQFHDAHDFRYASCISPDGEKYVYKGQHDCAKSGTCK
jgi:hypothetical protein